MVSSVLQFGCLMLCSSGVTADVFTRVVQRCKDGGTDPRVGDERKECARGARGRVRDLGFVSLGQLGHKSCRRIDGYLCRPGGSGMLRFDRPKWAVILSGGEMWRRGRGEPVKEVRI